MDSPKARKRDDGVPVRVSRELSAMADRVKDRTKIGKRHILDRALRRGLETEFARELA